MNAIAFGVCPLLYRSRCDIRPKGAHGYSVFIDAVGDLLSIDLARSSGSLWRKNLMATRAVSIIGLAVERGPRLRPTPMASTSMQAPWRAQRILTRCPLGSAWERSYSTVAWCRQSDGSRTWSQAWQSHLRGRAKAGPCGCRSRSYLASVSS